ncbi:sulfurtransferase [Stenomitos frigidus]|uniref:Sulfurtransferase n=1 Tax=Stenomitos frigidus ULC18 TaxID=2107698 RepID=A0A2T1E895_9CYAN|nr:sulfurtransferase [Stenomitos frigidus]PSB28957.1 sulfurtransferase [Stenomitos frigidus ULC18]
MISSVVSAAWLHDHLDDPQVAIADCRFSLMQPTLGQEQYQAGHIPGAVYLDLNQNLSSPIGKHGGRHPLPDVAQLASRLSTMGVHSSPEPTLVVAYDDSRLAFASRLWWLLRYLGHDRVAVLDGGFAGWNTAGYPVTQAVPPPKAGTFVPRPNPDQVVNIEAVKARNGSSGVVLVDSREPERYRGEHEPIDPIAGHIPGAVNYPWQEVTDANGYALPLAAQRERWETVQSAEEILVYCGSGVTACANLLSLELAGIQTGKLYAGSWSDWCSYEKEKG